jgi:hypothetical protein
MADAAARRPDVIETDASSSFVCDYVAGVNRVLNLPPYLLVDNIGRNFEVWRFRPGEAQPAARALYDLTAYPDDPIASLLDVDLHAAFLRGDSRELLTVNHYGRVRGFELPAPAARLQPAWELQLLGDTERIVMAGDCFIASSPRGEFTNDASQPGLFLFAPIGRLVRPASGETRRLECDQVLSEWGVIGALAVSAAADRLAVATGLRLGIFALACSSAGVRLGDCLWEAPLMFHCQWLHFDEAGRLWAAGHRPPSSAEANDDWDACRGGAVTAFAVDSADRQLTAMLPESTAWGYGADPVVLAADGRQLYVLGRDASLHVVDMTTRATHQPYLPLEAMAGVTRPSLGIGHMALRDRWLYAGFSRGGFRLLRYSLE